MKKLWQFALVCILGICMISCATSGGREPKWVSKPESMYPQTHYLCAVGYAESRKAAEEAAFASLAAYIRQDLSVKSVSVEQASDTVTGYTAKYTFNRQVASVSSIKQLVGAGIQETWADGSNTNYALAILNKQQASAYYSDQVKANNESVAKLVSIAEQKPASFESYSALKSAVQLAEENAVHLAILACVNPAQRALLQTEQRSPVSLFIAAEEEAQKIALAIQITGDIDGRIASCFSGIFRQLGVKEHDSIEKIGYVFYGELHFDPLPSIGGNIFLRYSLNASLADTRSAKTIYTFSHTGKDGHINEAEAVQRSLRSIETHINTKFAQGLTAALNTGIPQ